MNDRDPFDIVENPEDIIGDDEQGELPERSDRETEQETEEAGGDEEKIAREDETKALREEIRDLRLRQQQADEQAKFEREQAEARQEFERSRSTRLSALDSELDDLRSKRREAEEDADDERKEALEDQIAETRLRRIALRQAEYQEKRHARKQEEDNLAPAARAWMDLNPEFHTDQDFHGRVLAENRKLLDEGMNLADPKFYRELDRRLAQQEQALQRRANRSPSVAGVSRGNPGGSKTSNPRQFTSADRGKMVKYGFGDPSNLADRKAWLRFKDGRSL